MNRTTALIITCHKSNLRVLERTIKSALIHFPPENIHIADNGNEDRPTLALCRMVNSLDKRINYRYSKIGNKTLAQYLSCRFIISKVKKTRVRHVLMLDDDVVLPASLDLPTGLLGEVTKAVAIGIRGVDTIGTQDMIFTKWQDLEYKLSDASRLFQHQYASALFPHGAISLWDLSVLFRALTEHDAIFFADDVKLGIWLLKHGYRLGLHAETLVSTETPETLLGRGPNFYKQRVRSWDFAEHMLTLPMLLSLMQGYIKGRPRATLIVKFFQVYSIYTNLTDWLRVPVLTYSLITSPASFNTTFWIMIALNLFVILFWNYIGARNRPDIQVSLIAILSFPAYKSICSVIRIMSLLRCYLVYWPRFEQNLIRPGLMTEADVAKK
jgi:cellulose synthase/poly-beta-1,6-N-acetylglucosamine synthase-like glycosyltransferase